MRRGAEIKRHRAKFNDRSWAVAQFIYFINEPPISSSPAEVGDVKHTVHALKDLVGNRTVSADREPNWISINDLEASSVLIDFDELCAGHSIKLSVAALEH